MTQVGKILQRFLPLLLLAASVVQVAVSQPRIDPRHPEFQYFPVLGYMRDTSQGAISPHFGENVYPLGDVDHDGLADFALSRSRVDTVVNGYRPFELLLYHGVRDGVPTVESGQRIGPTEVGSKTRFLAAGDWDADGWQDLAVRIAVLGDTSGGNTDGLEIGYVVIFWGSSNGFALNDTTHLSNGEQVWLGINACVSYDANHDGADDLTVVGQLGMSDGKFVTKPGISIYRGGHGKRWGHESIARTADWYRWTTPKYNSVSAIDQNCDGAMDLAFYYNDDASGTGSIAVLYGSPDGGLPDTSNLIMVDFAPLNGRGRTSLLEDITGDGVAELLVSCGDEIMRVYAGEPGVKIDEQFGSGDDGPDEAHGRWYRRPWALVPLPRSMHDGWAFASMHPPMPLGDGNLDGINDIFTRAYPFLIEYNSGEFLDSLIDGMSQPPGDYYNMVKVGDIDGSTISSIAISYRFDGVMFIKPTKNLPETGVPRKPLHAPGVRCGAASDVRQQPEHDHSIELLAAPNPATDEVRISWDAPLVGAATLTICDALGRKAQSLTLTPSQREVIWKTTGVVGGVYFIRLVSGEHVVEARVVIRR